MEVDANNPMKYGMVASGGKDGNIQRRHRRVSGAPAPVCSSTPTFPTSTQPPLLEGILSLGGKTVMPRTDIGMVVMAIYVDPEGNTMGIIEG